MQRAVFLCGVLLLLAGCNVSPKEVATAQPSPGPPPIERETPPLTSFLVKMSVLEEYFRRLEHKFSPNMDDFHHWLDEFLSLCFKQDHKLIFEALVKKQRLKDISSFNTWCQISNSSLHKNILPYTSLVSPYQIDKDRRLKTFDTLSGILEKELARNPEEQDRYPFNYNRMLTQIGCSLSEKTEDIKTLLAITLNQAETSSKIEPAAVESIEAYFHYLDEKNITPPLSIWKYYEILATSR